MDFRVGVGAPNMNDAGPPPQSPRHTTDEQAARSLQARAYSLLGEGHRLVQGYPGAEGGVETSRRVPGHKGVPVGGGHEVLPQLISYFLKKKKKKGGVGGELGGGGGR